MVEVTISLSNLFKQQYLVNVETKARVINSDERFTSGFQALQADSYMVDPESDEFSDGFYEGLATEEVYVEPQPTPEEILEEARLEAERILAQARAQALQIKDDAVVQAEKLYEQKRQEGYNL